jgi:hypothetical protein
MHQKGMSVQEFNIGNFKGDGCQAYRTTTDVGDSRKPPELCGVIESVFRYEHVPFQMDLDYWTVAKVVEQADSGASLFR